jgi:integrase
MLDIEIESKVRWNVDPEKPWELLLTKEEEKILNAVTALKEGLHHWEEWTTERVVTSGSVTPLVKKRWETILKKFAEWAGDEYPSRSSKQLAVQYKKYLLTRTSRTGMPAKQSTVAKEIRDLSAFWNWAKRHEWVSHNIWDGLARGLEASEQHPLPNRKLVEDADNAAFVNGDVMYMIQRFTGCRKQAVAGLRGVDICLKTNTIHFVQYKEDGRVRWLKNGQEAHVPIHSRLLPILRKMHPSFPDGAIWPEQYKPSEQTWGDRYGDSFPDRYGFKSHDLRRIVETQMAEANVSPYFAFHITGHRVPGMSEVTQRYVRPTVDELREVVEKIH